MRRSFCALSIGLILGATPAAAQVGTCNVVSSRLAEREFASGVPLVRLEGPFLIRCEGGAEIRALEGTLNQLTSEVALVGDVFFQDPDRTLTADRATYTAPTGRLYALGNVVFTNRAEGSTLRGPELEYYRETDERPVSRAIATQRPHLTLEPRGESEDAEPLELDGDRITIVGNDDLTAIGNVVIVQSEVHATSEEARYRGATEELDLEGSATVQGSEFDLSGDTIQIDLAEGSLETVHAQRNAVLTGEDLEVSAPDLQLFFAADSLQRLVARTTGVEGDTMVRAIALAEAFRLEADSIDALLPGQQLERVIAIGDAHGEAIDTAGVAPEPVPGDSIILASSDVPPVLANDWVVGDTIIGYFMTPDSATLAPGDTASTQLRKLVASGSAQALYRAQPDDETDTGPPGVNYLSGKVIELNFSEGELQLAIVSSLRRGMYLEPMPPPPAMPADSAATGRSR